MPKTIVHTDDLPAWAVRKSKMPQSYLGFLTEAVHTSPDGKGLVSLEDLMLRQHWDAMLMGNAKARDWLLREIIADNKAVLEAGPKKQSVTIDGIHHFQPLAPVLEILGCVTVTHPEDDSDAPATVALAPWFVDELHKRCPVDRLAPVLEWQESGGKQTPRVNRDGHD